MSPGQGAGNTWEFPRVLTRLRRAGPIRPIRPIRNRWTCSRL